VPSFDEKLFRDWILSIKNCQELVIEFIADIDARAFIKELKELVYKNKSSASFECR